MARRQVEPKIDRLNDGRPILGPNANWWEAGVVFNAAAVYLPPAPENKAVIEALVPPDAGQDGCSGDGVVAVLYRARPDTDPGYDPTRSFMGLAVFTPELELIKRYPEPVLTPDDDPKSPDHLGVEDPRITRFGAVFYCVYCGVRVGSAGRGTANLCLARSPDFLQWVKLGVVRGNVNRYENKDGVLFPGNLGGRYFMLHRPAIPSGRRRHHIKNMHLAVSSSIEGEWHDQGVVLKAFQNPAYSESWVGAGSVPIPVGDDRYLVIYHIGNWLRDGRRQYDLAAALFDLRLYGPEDPSKIVVKRLEPLMEPETDFEIQASHRESVGNVLFTCGSYEYKGYIYIIYGGADTYTLAARVKKDELLEKLEQSGLDNPFTD